MPSRCTMSLISSPVTAVAVAAFFNADPLQEVLTYWSEHLHWEGAVRMASYGQVFQTLLDPASVFGQNPHGHNVVLIRGEELSAQGAELLQAVQGFLSAGGTSLTLMVCPEQTAVEGSQTSLAAFAALPGVTVLDAEQWQAVYPVDAVFDPEADRLGHVPYTPEYFAVLGTILARAIQARRTAPKKVAVLDCDQTLWQGTTGEDGPDQVRLDEGRRALHEFFVKQREQGLLLCLCSKNNEEDVWETFRLHPEFPLRPEHFTAWRIDWEAKGPNLASLARELNLGLDSFVFLDDDAKECAEAAARCPDVVTVPLPHDSRDMEPLLQHLWVFDRPTVTEEDRQRAGRYAAQSERGQLARESASLKDFIRALELRVQLSRAAPEQWPRVAQLTQRTNQMNTTTQRLTLNELQTRLEGGGVCWVAQVGDRFGDYGLVGAMIGEFTPDVLRLDSFLLSCRALGRGVEHRMLAYAGAEASQRGQHWVDVPVTPTAKNAPAQTFLREVSGTAATLYRLSADHLQQLQYEPKEGVPDEAPPLPAHRPSLVHPVNYVGIAQSLRRPADILSAVRARRRAHAATGLGAPPRTPLEQQIAEVWSEVLGVTAVGADDDFFDLGGHSLLAVELLSQVNQRVGSHLSLDVVYGGPLTVAAMAQAIELREAEGLDPSEYAALLAEVEGLSDEEVQRLLAEQDEGVR